MDTDLLLAIAERESNFNPEARGSSGEMGMFQIMPENVKKFSTPDEDPFNVAVNTRMASALLQEELDRYDNDTLLAVAAYNAGSPNVNEAIAAAGSRDFETIKPYLPPITQEYVPDVMNKYAARKEKRLNEPAPDAENEEEEELDYSQWGSPDEFKTEVRDYATRDGFNELTPKEQAQGISRIYQGRKWLPQVDAALHSVTKAIWDNAEPEQRPDISEIINPYLSLVEGKNSEEVTKASAFAKQKMQRDLEDQGFNWNLVGSIIDETFTRKEAKEQSDVRGVLGEGATWSKEVAKGALELFTGAAAGAADLYGDESAARAAREIGQNALGENLDLYYELDDNGNILFDQNNEPVTKYRGNILRGVGSVVGAVGTLFAAKGAALAAGATAAAATTASALGLGGLNLLNSMGQAYELANEETGSREDAMQAAMWTAPTSVLNTIADLYTVGAGKFWIQGLTGQNKVRAVAQLATRSAAFGAAGNVAEQTGIEFAAQYATESGYQASRKNIVSAGIGGAVAGAALGGIFDGYGFRPKPQTKQTPAPIADETTETIPSPPGAIGPIPDTSPRLLPAPTGPRRGLPIPERYQSGEPVLLPQTASAEQQIELAQRFESFALDSEQRMILDFDSPESIPQELLALFGYEAEQLSPKQVAIIKRESYQPPVAENLDQIDTAVDRLSIELAAAPDPQRHAALVDERANLKRELFKVTKSNRETESNASQLAQEKSRLEKEIKVKEKQRRSFRDPILHGVLDNELADLRNQLEPLTQYTRSQEGRAVQIREQINLRNEQLRQLQDPLYLNNRAAKQRTLADLLRKRAELTNEARAKEFEQETDPQYFKEAAVRVRLDPDLTVKEDTAQFFNDAETDADSYFILPMNGKWFALNGEGSPITGGHKAFKDALRALQQTQLPRAAEVDAVQPGTSPQGKALRIGVQLGKATGASKEQLRLAKKGQRELDKTPVPKETKQIKRKDDKQGRSEQDLQGSIVFEDDLSSQIQYGNVRDIADSADEKQTADVTAAGVVDVDPIQNEGVDIKGARALRKEAEKIFKQAAKRGAMPAKNVLGYYWPKFKVVRTKFRGDLQTTLHELAHSKDDELHLGKLANLVTDPNNGRLAAELWELGKGGSGGTNQRSFQYNMAEGAAEYIRAWMVNPAYTEKTFPATHEYMQRRLPEDFRIGVRNLGDDVRRFAGAPAIKQVASAVAWTPEQKTALDNLRTFLGTGTKDFELTGKDQLVIKWLNDRHALVKAKAIIEERTGEKLLPQDDFEMLGRLHSGLTDKQETAINFGIPDVNNPDVRTTKGIREEIMEHLDTSSEDSLTSELKLMSYKMVVERATEKEGIRAAKTSKNLSRIGPIAGYSGFSNLLEKSNLTEAEVTKRFNEEWQKLPAAQRTRINKAVKGYRNMSDKLLRYAVEKGLLSEKGYEKIKSQNEFYVSMMRVLDGDGFDAINKAAGSGQSLSRTFNALPAFTGSGAEIQNPLIGLMSNVYRVIGAADRNHILAKFTEAVGGKRQGMYDPRPAFGDIGEKVEVVPGNPDKDVVPVRRNGELEHWKFHPGIKEALDGYASLGSNNWFVNFIGKVNSYLQAGIVYSPQFINRNFLRDTVDRFVQSDVGTVDQAKQTIRAATAIVSKTGRAKRLAELRQAGGAQGGHYMDDPVSFYQALEKQIQEISEERGSVLSIPARIWEGWKNFAADTELIGRLSEYEAQKRKAKEDFGYDDTNAAIYAASKARGVLDFAVVGERMRTIRKLVPFSNASMQYMRRSLKTLREHPGQLAARTLLFAVLPQLLTRAYNESQGAEDEYNQQPSYRKNLFFMMKMGDGWVWIPKPFPVVMAAAAVDRAYDAAKGLPPPDDLYASLAISQLSPIGPEAIAALGVKPMIEVMANRDFFRDKTIVPPYEERLNLENRPQPKGTSALANLMQDAVESIGLGDSFIGKRVLNARAIDHQLRGYFGTLGGLILSGSDTLTGGKANPLSTRNVFGLTGDNAIYGSKDVEYVMKFAEGEGISIRNKKMQKLKNAIDNYFGAEGAAEKEELSKAVYETAASIREGIESRGRKYFGVKKNKNKEVVPDDDATETPEPSLPSAVSTSSDLDTPPELSDEE